ncbi:MAG: SCO family protein [Phycisphaeraceae bacterium]
MPMWDSNESTTRRTPACQNGARSVLRFALGLCLVLALGSPASATVYNSRNPENTENVNNPWTEDLAREVGVIEKLNSPIPMDLRFVDESGSSVELGSFFKDGRPVILNLGYSRCPSICIAMRNQLVEAMPEVELDAGRDFLVLNISIDPEETPEVAAKMRETTLAQLNDKGIDASAEGWRYLTGGQEAIAALTDAVGYRYLYIEPQNEYGHPGVLVLADGEGMIRRYLSGTAYSGRTLRLSIVETSQGKVGSLLDQAFVTCFVWDAEANNYTATATFIMMLGGAVTVLFVAGGVVAGFAYEKRRRQMIGDDGRPTKNRPPRKGQPTPA